MIDTSDYLHVMCEYCEREPAIIKNERNGEPFPCCKACLEIADCDAQ
jgi:hypothetical protein